MISAVVVNYNGIDYLEPCLDALLAQRPPPDEVVLADNHSDDGSRAFVAARYPAVRVIDTGVNGGPGRARNHGVAAARHDRVLLLDNDVVMQPGALESLCEVADDHKCTALVQARSLCHDRPDHIHYDGSALHVLGLLVFRNFFAPLAGAVAPDGPIGGAVGLCCLVDRPRYQAVGGCHEELFFYFEDTDLAWRLRLAGHQLRLAPAATVLHGGGTAGLSQRRGRPVPGRRIEYHSRNRWAVLLTCMHWRTLILSLPVQLLYAGVHFAYAIVDGHGLAWLRGKVRLLAMLPTIWRWRRTAQRSRAVRDRDLLVAEPLTTVPGVADRGVRAWLRRTLDGVYGLWWRLIRPLC